MRDSRTFPNIRIEKKRTNGNGDGMGKRVVVLYRRSLLTQAVEGLLKGRTDLEVIGVDLDNEGATSQVEQAHPECIIVDDADLPETWSHLSFQLWRENPRIKFVYLNMSQNSAEVVGG